MRRLICFSTIAILYLLSITISPCLAENYTLPVNGNLLTEYTPNVHRGVDVSANAGQSIAGICDGKVFAIGKTPRNEPYVSVEHANGLTSTYLPVKATVGVGQSIIAGEQIGVLGSEIDLSCNEQHLHLGIYETASRSNKTYVDPCSVLAFVRTATGQAVEGESAVLPATQNESLATTLDTNKSDVLTGNARVVSEPCINPDSPCVTGPLTQTVPQWNESAGRESNPTSMSDMSGDTLCMKPGTVKNPQNASLQQGCYNPGSNQTQTTAYNQTPKGVVEPGHATAGGITSSAQAKAASITGKINMSSTAASTQEGSYKGVKQNVYPSVGASLMQASISSRASSMAANPFVKPITVTSRDAMGTKSQAAQTLNQARPVDSGISNQTLNNKSSWSFNTVGRVLDWPYLPNFIVVLLLLTMTALSMRQYMRAEIGAPMLGSY